MNEKRFTPGPWKFEKNSVRCEVKMPGAAIALPHSDEANARLIAAAPEMFDALKRATHTCCVTFCANRLPRGAETGMVTFIKNGCPLGVEMCDMAKWWEIIRKVIE